MTTSFGFRCASMYRTCARTSSSNTGCRCARIDGSAWWYASATTATTTTIPAAWCHCPARRAAPANAIAISNVTATVQNVDVRSSPNGYFSNALAPIVNRIIRGTASARAGRFSQIRTAMPASASSAITQTWRVPRYAVSGGSRLLR